MEELRGARGHWVARDLVAWNASVEPGTTFRLHHDADSFDLAHDPNGLPENLRAKFPHLRELKAFRLPAGALSRVPAMLRGAIGISATRGGHLVDATGLQIPGVLDDLFAYDGPLGVWFTEGVPTLRLWAPTARQVRLLLYGVIPSEARDLGGGSQASHRPDSSLDARNDTVIPMSFDTTNGVWSVRGSPDWKNRFYLYEVEVYVPSTARVETNRVTDPYSISLSTNSRLSQIVDLDDPELKPKGWDSFTKPPLEDIVIYELHVRDFSGSDDSVPPEHRGTFMAFTHPDSRGMRHLRSLAEAGLTHVQLLPVCDFTSVNDIRAEHKHPGDLSRFPPDSDQQQAAIATIKDEDGYNWGYDPWHYNVPEGSYATDPEGSRRILEFREMVKGLADAGLRVVMDVAYNHTFAAGQDEKSVLDRIVPGYYHRLDADGKITTSTCCPNTATEHAMMEKLMIDSVLTWVRAYRIDGFRFDLMGHHMKSNLVKLRDRLRVIPSEARDLGGGSRHPDSSLDARNDTILLYGEGWNFGEVANGARGANATMINLAGTRIGTFNDRMRDAVRGGGPFSGLQEPGVGNGLTEVPGASGGLSYLTDLIRIGLAGSLKELPIAGMKAGQIDFRGYPAGYTEDPKEAVNYVASHDGETLFDTIVLKTPRQAPMSDRVRMNNLAVSLVMLAQGPAFFHAGDEMLRSKSLDRNSHDSGDWFNRLDFSLQSNNFGVGLPLASENQRHWGVMRPLLADPALKPAPQNIQRAVDHFREMLRIRKSSALFRLPDARAVLANLRFHDAGAGVIVMSIADRVGVNRELIVAIFNANRDQKTFALSELAGADLFLHPEQQTSTDPVVREAKFEPGTGTFFIPGRTTIIFWGLTALR